MSTEKPVVAVIMGSQSDWATMQNAVEILKKFKIPYECRIVSAHRTPDRLDEYATTAADCGLKVIIAGAGGAAHLPGMVASKTHLPVFGVPVQSRALSGIDSVYSILQMPRGVPVATFSIGESGATNAALEAVRVLALHDDGLKERLIKYIEDLRESVSCYVRGKVVNEGKTKIVHTLVGPDVAHLAALESKDDITAGDGKKHDIIPGKARMATATTVNVFECLMRSGVPVAYHGPDTRTSFISRLVDMLPYEVVIRGEADGSYLERNPDLKRGQRFTYPVVEFYLKTKGKRWKEHELVCDDPLMDVIGGEIRLYDAHAPLKKPFLVLNSSEVYTQKDESSYFVHMEGIAKAVFEQLSSAWETRQGRLIDLKIEFGVAGGELLVADVIDNDSWRVWRDGSYIDKQRYRNGEDLARVEAVYRLVEQLTAQF